MEKITALYSKLTLSNFKQNNLHSIALVGLLLCICLFFWTLNLSILPGLHGDEAWFGLRSLAYLETGIRDFTGMNNYTGNLQSLSQVMVFKIFGTGVAQLRSVGVVFNFIGLVILCYALHKHNFSAISIILLLFILQSTLYLCSPRVAWEVNSFTLFFCALLIYTLLEIQEGRNRHGHINKFVFLATNVLGTYNHVIFSCIALSLTFAIILYAITKGIKTSSFKELGLLFLINTLNVAITFGMMTWGARAHDLMGGIGIASAATLTVVFELIHIHRISLIIPDIRPQIPARLPNIFLIVFATPFVWFHGLSLVKVFSNYTILIHFFSSQPSIFITAPSTICALIFLAYLAYSIYSDIVNGKNIILTYFILCYLGVFNLYTTSSSSRYYLTIYLIVILYASLKIKQELTLRTPIVMTILTMLILTHSQLYTLLNNPYRSIKSTAIKLNMHQTETSSHFLPKEPVIDYLRNNHIGSILYDTDEYFLEQPILFYYKLTPWRHFKHNQIIIGYETQVNGNGFKFNKKNSQ